MPKSCRKVSEINGDGCLPLTRVAEGGGAVVNERPVDVQSRTVTEPQRDVERDARSTEINGDGCLPLTRVAEDGGAVVNERPVDVQSRTVTEPQRDVERRSRDGGRESVKN